MMHEREKSDPAVVAVKPTNKAERSAAEPVERRAGANGNADQHNTCRAQYRVSVSQALERIRQVRRHSLEVGAVCGKAARTVLCGGRSAMGVPTAIASLAMTVSKNPSACIRPVIARSEATKQSILPLCGKMDCLAEPVTGRALRGPVGLHPTLLYRARFSPITSALPHRATTCRRRRRRASSPRASLIYRFCRLAATARCGATDRKRGSGR